MTEYLYRFYDDDGDLLYVGVTRDPASRWVVHCGRPWWPQVASIAIERFETRAESEAAEIVAIKSERPRFNIRYNNDADTVRQAPRTPEPFWTEPPVGEDELSPVWLHAEAAKYLGCREVTLRGWCRTGRGPARHKLPGGHLWRYRKTDLDAYLIAVAAQRETAS